MTTSSRHSVATQAEGWDTLVGMTALSPEIDARVRRTFERQKVMATIGAEITDVSTDGVEIVIPHRDDLTQQHGFLHAGIVSTVLDTACGLAALANTPPDTAVLAVEFKVNFLAPAKGDRVIVRGRTVRSGRTLHTCVGDAYAIVDGEEKHVATLMSTVMTIEGRGFVD
jgi:uncharacterized protein (TIGR00369 family)